MQEPLLVIVGPTAVGKTSLSLPIAQALDAEIVNVDSRQIYRYMDIGTAKPSMVQQAQVVQFGLREAGRIGLPAPTNAFMTQLVRALEAKQSMLGLAYGTF